VTWVNWKLVSIYLKIVLISVQDRCINWNEHTIGSEIILGTNAELLGDAGKIEACFSLFGDCANLDTR
jgi:hypothetical protein